MVHVMHEDCTLDVGRQLIEVRTVRFWNTTVPQN